jgi:ABC-type Mn2+/Zn2+ transport system ATPase subunit
MIAFANVSKQYGGQILFVEASFQVNPGEKIGLVGPNGAGKSTVFRLIVGEELPDDGQVERPKKLTLGYFRQDVGELKGRSILAETCAGAGEVATLADELARLTAQLEEGGDDLDRVVERFADVEARYSELGGYQLEGRANAILAGLGFAPEQIGDDVGTLSGGWKMRVALAQILLAQPDVLLLDEPTNYLDLESILWLEAFLKRLPGRGRDDLPRPRDHEPRRQQDRRDRRRRPRAPTAGNYDFYERCGPRRRRARGRVRAPAGDARQGEPLHRAVQGPRREGRAGGSRGSRSSTRSRSWRRRGGSSRRTSGSARRAGRATT